MNIFNPNVHGFHEKLICFWLIGKREYGMDAPLPPDCTGCSSLLLWKQGCFHSIPPTVRFITTLSIFFKPLVEAGGYGLGLPLAPDSPSFQLGGGQAVHHPTEEVFARHCTKIPTKDEPYRGGIYSSNA
ncbi:hypothetical protein JEZ13_00310 [bacterium]|nr:hypothetical protein [bacterium]